MRIVIPSFHYADMLAVGLRRWREMFPGAEITVVTSWEDTETTRVARRVNVALVHTEAWKANGATLDKAAALDVAFGFTGRVPPPKLLEPCISADADVVPFGALDQLQADTLYGCPRYHCPDPETLEGVMAGRVTRSQLQLIGKDYHRGAGDGPAYMDDEPELARKLGSACLGYFQAWRHRPHDSFGSFPTAAKYDLAFRDTFARRECLTAFHVLHLGPCTKRNWTGRVVPGWNGSKKGADDVFTV